MSNITVEEFKRFASGQVPLVEKLGFKVESIGDGECSVRAVYSEDFLRPGGTISGPVLMALADFSMYGAIVGRAGAVQQAVTTSFNINFLLRPEPRDIVANAKILKMGKRLVVGSVDLMGNEAEELVAHATCTYSLPNMSEDRIVKLMRS